MITILFIWTFISLFYCVYNAGSVYRYKELIDTNTRFLAIIDFLLLPTIVIMSILDYTFKR
jgi:hypothetical protein